MQRHIVLVGMMGAGKTALGAELARRMSMSFVDVDAEIETAAAMSIPEIFARDGEAFFRAREAQILRRILSGPAGIVSTGGGAFVQPGNRDLILEKSHSVWLDCPIEILWPRVKLRPTRPLLQTEDPRGTLERLIAEREPSYAQADLRFSARSGETLYEAGKRLHAQLQDYLKMEGKAHG